MVNLWNFIKSETKLAELKLAELAFRRLDLDFDARIGIEDWIDSISIAFRPTYPSYRHPNVEQLDSSPRIDENYPDSGPSRLNTQSDFRNTGQKFGMTYRSTADKTFSDSRQVWRNSRSPNRRVITDTYNYYEDDVPIQKEITTTITRRLPLETRPSNEKRKVEKQTSDMKPLILENYSLEGSSSKNPYLVKREDTIEGSDYNIREASAANPGGTQRSNMPQIPVDEVIQEEVGNEEDVSSSKPLSKKKSISERPKEDLQPPKKQPLAESQVIKTNLVPTDSKGTKLGPRGSIESNLSRGTDLFFLEQGIETKRFKTLLTQNSQLSGVAILPCMAKNIKDRLNKQGETERTRYSGSHRLKEDLKAKNEALKKPEMSHQKI